MRSTLKMFMLLGIGLTGILCAASVSAAAEKPNILIILADDLGYADLGVQGSDDMLTPNIDALAKRGVRCTNGYASHAFCSPMRAGLLSGRYQHRFGYTTNVGYDPYNIWIGLPMKEKTFAKRLQETGYKTGMAGKWHLGASHAHHPLRRGFDFFCGFLGGGHDYFEIDLKRPMHEGYFQPIDRNGEPENFSGYLTDALSDEAVGFVERNSNKEEPFLFYLSYNAPHTPLQATADDLEKFNSIKDKRRRTYAAMVHAMDRGIGRVIAALDKAGERDNTIVFFLSDNGGPTKSNASSNLPLRGFKGDVFEGGVRVPFIVSWPGQLPEGMTYDQPVISIDISRTALELSGAKIVPKLEGVNLIPFLKAERKEPPHEALFWRSGPKWAVRMGGWKLMKDKSMSKPALFNLSEDISEKNDLAAEKPEVVKELRAKYDAWNKANLAPIFPSYREYHEKKKAFYEELRSKSKSQ